MNCCVSKSNFETKFLRTGDPKNCKCIAFREGFDEILQSHAKSVCEKLGHANGKEMAKDWISDNAMTLLKETVDENKFEHAGSMLKRAGKISNGSKHLSFSEDGNASLKDTSEIADESDADLTDNTSDDLMEDCFILFKNVEMCEIECDSDSSDSSN